MSEDANFDCEKLNIINSIDNQSNNSISNVILFPNPVHSRIFINIKEAFNISRAVIYDIYGNVMIDALEDDIEFLDVSNLKSGLYFLFIKDKVGRKVTRSFVKH